MLAAVFNMLGPLLLGTAVADTVGGIVKVQGAAGIEVIGAGLLAAVLWKSEVGCAAALTLGTALGGWKIMKTIGRGLYHIQPLEGLSSQSASAGVIFGASLLGARVSTTHVVASSVVGIGAGRRRWRHIHWAVVGAMGIAWVTMIPATAALATRSRTRADRSRAVLDRVASGDRLALRRRRTVAAAGVVDRRAPCGCRTLRATWVPRLPREQAQHD